MTFYANNTKGYHYDNTIWPSQLIFTVLKHLIEMTLLFLEIQIHREGLTVNTIESNMKDGLLLLWENIT